MRSGPVQNGAGDSQDTTWSNTHRGLHPTTDHRCLTQVPQAATAFPRKLLYCLRSQADRLPLLLESPGAKGAGGLSERRWGSRDEAGLSRGGGALEGRRGAQRGGGALREEAGHSKPLTGFPVRSSPISSQSQPQICSSSA